MDCKISFHFRLKIRNFVKFDPSRSAFACLELFVFAWIAKASFSKRWFQYTQPRFQYTFFLSERMFKKFFFENLQNYKNTSKSTTPFMSGNSDLFSNLISQKSAVEIGSSNWKGLGFLDSIQNRLWETGTIVEILTTRWYE